MASFQIVYDDFSGGQYMGPRATNWPKNTYQGTNIVTLPDGTATASGALLAAQNTGVTSSTNAQIFDSWFIGDTVYVFAQWFTSPSTYAPRMLSSAVNDGTVFPVTFTSATLGATIVGKVAYDPTGSQFFYADSSGNIRKVTTAGTDSSVSTALSGQAIAHLALYNYRIVGWSGLGKKLWYSGTDLTSWSTGQYYEFDGYILNVLPRANDLLVFCTTGVYSMVGILGSSVTNQLIVPQTNLTEGMRDATLMGRNAYFLDQSQSGSLDGRLYELVGSRVSPVATFNLTDINNVTDRYQPGRVQALSNNNMAVAMQSGVVYATTSPGQWTRFNTTLPTIDGSLTNQISIPRCGPNAMNDFFLVALVDNSGKFPVKVYRFIHSVTSTVTLDQKFVFGTGAAAAGTNQPVGTMVLPEYWHPKPLTVKEVLVQYKQGSSGSLMSVQIEPTGLIEATPTQVSSSWSSSSDSTYGPGGAGYVLNRFRPDDAMKSYGIKPTLTLTGPTIVKRVILNCED